MIALVDDEDFERVNQFKWYATTTPTASTWYAHRAVKGKLVLEPMPKFILQIKGMVDHVDGNGLNNQRSNLRPTNRSGNRANSKKQSGTTSKYKGVSASRGKWVAHIFVFGKGYHLGNYETEEDAAISYNHAALAYFGEFARLNLV